jgi:hypothetical protein
MIWRIQLQLRGHKIKFRAYLILQQAFVADSSSAFVLYLDDSVPFCPQ